MEKMDIYREEVDNEKMIRTTDKQRRLRGFDIEGKKDVKIKKRSEYADGKKKKVGPGPCPAENRQSPQCEEANQRQQRWNAVESHRILILKQFCSLERSI